MNPRQRRLRRLRRKDRHELHQVKAWQRHVQTSVAELQAQLPAQVTLELATPAPPTGGSLLSAMLQGKPLP